MIYLLTSCNTEERIAQNIYIHNSNKNYIFIIYPLTIIALNFRMLEDVVEPVNLALL